ncbi:MAG: type III-B CRISPR module RAMP protein Cmr4 [Candidatus Hydrothermia bacterium]|nr:type III-B CRISPR module RAMP protein Cmr4 [Candidatus Hydrothermia bacterium]
MTFYAETPIHMGAGQSVSYVDLPVQRERHTSFPVLWSSGIKGVIRDLASRVWNDKDKVETIFGPEDGSSDFASCISITDAKILLYPVRSVKGVFAWITCPFVLKRFKEDLNAVGINLNVQIFDVSDDKVLVSNSSVLRIDNNQVALEEFVFKAEVKNEVKELAEFLKRFVHQNDLNLENHLAIVSDNVFRDFVNYAVEIRTRIRIDQTKGTVKEGALFSEELIPSESVFYSLIFITDPYFGIEKELYNEFLKTYVSGIDWNSAKIQIKGEIENLKQSQNKEDKEKASRLEREFNKIKDEIEKRMKKSYENGYFVADSQNKRDILEQFRNLLDNSLLQLGGDETTGKGYVRVKFNEGNKQSSGQSANHQQSNVGKN